MKKIIVIKIGGGVLGEWDNHGDYFIYRVSLILERYISRGYQVIVVVSAFAGETRKQKIQAEAWGYEIGTSSYDLIVSQGEMVSSKAIFDQCKNAGYHVAQLDYDDFPIITDDNFGNAKVIDVDSESIANTLADNQILIVPGFIGKTKGGETTTLGFEGSDTSAVEIAVAMKVDCVLYKNTAYRRADPKYVNDARVINTLHIDDAIEFAEKGASIIHIDALKKTKSSGIDIVVQNYLNGDYTIITARDIVRADIVGIAVNKIAEGFEISIVRENPVRDELYRLISDEYSSISISGKPDTAILHNEALLSDVMTFIYNSYELYKGCLQNKGFTPNCICKSCGAQQDVGAGGCRHFADGDK